MKGNLEKAPAPPLQQKFKLFSLGSSQEAWFTRTSESQSEPWSCQAHNTDSEGPGGHQMRSRAETQEKVCSAWVHLYFFFNSQESLDSQENRSLSSVSMEGMTCRPWGQDPKWLRKRTATSFESGVLGWDFSKSTTEGTRLLRRKMNVLTFSGNIRASSGHTDKERASTLLFLSPSFSCLYLKKSKHECVFAEEH